ncbi:MAG: hypothetical protein GX053_04320 [Tissierella sp.]|nr:hypothetical protein [Tissierella sp.]
MKKKIIITISILVILIIFSTITYHKKVKTERYENEELREHYSALVSISVDLEKYNADSNGEEEFYLRGLLRASRGFEIAINSYENVSDDEVYRNNGRDVPYILDKYFDLFIESTISTDQIDYETLDAIKDDFYKWYIWIEDHYVYTDDNGYMAFKMYTVDDMIESGLLDEFKLMNLEELNRIFTPGSLEMTEGENWLVKVWDVSVLLKDIIIKI